MAAALSAAVTSCRRDVGALPPPQVLNYQLYVGGKGKAKANLAPVTLGFINVQGGPPNFNFPQAKSVIRGRREDDERRARRRPRAPGQAQRVLIAQAEEEGVRCGQQMVNDKVKAILFGFVTIGNQSIYATVKGTKPIIGLVTANAADPTAKNAYFLNGSQTSVLGRLRHLHEAAAPEGEDRGNRLSDRPGRDHGGAGAPEGHAADRA